MAALSPYYVGASVLVYISTEKLNVKVTLGASNPDIVSMDVDISIMRIECSSMQAFDII